MLRRVQRVLVIVFLCSFTACNRDELTSGPDVRALQGASTPAPAMNVCDSPPTVQALRALRVVVNEVLLENQSGLQDEDGDRVPWVEIFNAGTESVNLGGVPFSDEILNSRKWEIPCIPEAVVPAGAYLIVFLSGKASTLGGLHTSFTIEPTGRRQIILNGGSDIATVNADELEPDVSAGRFPDGDRVFRRLGTPTPRAPNVDPAGEPMDAKFLRGDADEDGQVSVSDSLALLRFLFDGEPAPACLDRLDVDDDGTIGLADSLFLKRALFASDSIPPRPYPSEGYDPTSDGLDCPP